MQFHKFHIMFTYISQHITYIQALNTLKKINYYIGPLLLVKKKHEILTCKN